MTLAKSSASSRDIRIAIDRGGTFTDVYAVKLSSDDSAPQQLVLKLLSVDKKNYQDANVEGIRRVLEAFTGQAHPRDKPIDTSRVASIRMGTTVATNALLERNGERCAFVTTRGFKDLLHIGTQSRPNIFDIQVRAPTVLQDTVLEVDERVTLLGYTTAPKGMTVDADPNDKTIVKGVTGELVKVVKPLDTAQLRKNLQQLYDDGLRSVAICFMHSYTYPEHERQAADVAREVGFSNVTTSSSIMATIKIVPRGMTSVTDAYLTPKIQQYIGSFMSGFDAGLKHVRVEFMRSDGGLAPMNSFRGYGAILSGPAGGVVGYALTSFSKQSGTPVIGFDMGGTSTDVSRYDGHYEHVFETTTAGVTICSPQLDINTVAAGGSSCLTFRNGMFVVGPESAGSEPGPICYRKNGLLAITDANLLLGRISVAHFPHIFGTTEDQPLDLHATQLAFSKLTEEINAFLKTQGEGRTMTPDEIAYGFIRVANETMGSKVLQITQAKGHDVEKHHLACFGGAAAQHAVEIARSIGISRVLVHRYAGLSLADSVHEVQEPAQTEFTGTAILDIEQRVAALTQQCTTVLCDQGFATSDIEIEVYLNLRYQGTDTSLMTKKPDDSWDLVTRFTEAYVREFGFKLDRSIVLDDIRIRGVGKSQNALLGVTSGDDLQKEIDTMQRKPAPKELASGQQSVYFHEQGRTDTLVFLLEHLSPGHTVTGPALLLDRNSTILVPPGYTALVTKLTVVIDVSVGAAVEQVRASYDPIQLSLFGHRFMNIAEQMGHTLQKTSISTNIKERLDFSCALFSPEGHLVANAPHIPVHLGSMQEAIKWQLAHWGDNLHDGDVLVSNHPMCGGSHLPDITVITPVFEESGKDIVFFVASRGHHADIGGISPGSMPPHSKELYQEGAAIRAFKLVEGGVFQEEGIRKLLLVDPAQYPGCSGTRNWRDNLSDLRAQVAANNRGIFLVRKLILEYGLEVVHSYMTYIREHAELAVSVFSFAALSRESHIAAMMVQVRDLLRHTAKRYGQVLRAEDYMDDGSPICLQVTIDEQAGSAVFDFAGTGPEVYGNINAPPSVCMSAIIYCMRCLLDLEIPLNQGCLSPIDVRIPKQSLLSPSDGAAVVGGNVMTSQRLVDVILRAFDVCAASQGDCNNLTFGCAADDQGENGWGYYETIAGGSGAGPTWHGRSGVHTHMTNTRITDPEILERRYPVILHQFSLRGGSGGAGQYRGGDGVVREMEFTVPNVQVSILSERRVFRPYGLHGGQSGAAGLNLLRRAGPDGQHRMLNLGGKNTVLAHAGDRIVIHTPGGGGYGQVKR
ncbi:hypothetical protein RI367_003637 [Sorochytrium milnesiophthora]